MMWHSGSHASTTGSVWAPAFRSRWLFEECFQGMGAPKQMQDVFITSSTVLTLSPSQLSQIPSFLLCYAFSSQRSLQSVTENDYKLRIVLSFIVIKCMFLPSLSRPTPFQGQSTG